MSAVAKPAAHARTICVFLDRDGTLIRHIPYLCDPRRVELLPTVVPGLTQLAAAGCKLFLHTNQSGIGRGYFSLEQALACNEEMMQQIGLGPDLFADVCVCPEVPDEPARYRKPSPSYGREIIERYATTASCAYYLGDNLSDLLTARNLGCTGVGVNTGIEDLQLLLRDAGLQNEFAVFNTFIEAATHIVARSRA